MSSQTSKLVEEDELEGEDRVKPGRTTATPIADSTAAPLTHLTLTHILPLLVLTHYSQPNQTYDFALPLCTTSNVSWQTASNS